MFDYNLSARRIPAAQFTISQTRTELHELKIRHWIQLQTFLERWRMIEVEISLQNLEEKERRFSHYDVYSNACGGAGSSSTAIVEAVPVVVDAAAAAFGAVDERESVRANASGSVGRRSFSRTKPDGADFTGTYLLSSRNLMNFS